MSATVDQPQVFAEQLLEAIPPDTRRICLAGAGVGDLALRYAEGGSFVTVVNPDAAECAALDRELRSGGLSERVTVWNKRYLEHTFETSGLDALAVYDAIGSPSEVKNVFKKCRREVRVGGLFFMVQRVDPRFIDFIPLKVANAWEGLAHILGQLDWFTRHWPLLNGLNGELVQEFANEYVTVEESGFHQLWSPYVQAVGSLAPRTLVDRLARLLPGLARFEDRLLFEDELRLFARTLLIAGKMETQMGRVFKIRSTRSV